MSKQTALHAEHVNRQAKMLEFAGYDMPIQYPLGAMKEHEWVRSSAGLFDVSHMGQAIVEGPKAAEFFSTITPSSFMKTPHSMAKYTVLTNAEGGIIDDLIITRMTDDKFFVVFNAGRKDVDIAWMKENLGDCCHFEFLADHALMALQGQQAEAVMMQECPEANLSELGYMRMTEASWQGVPIFISRLGYTGEDGFEISIPGDSAAKLWNKLLGYDQVEAIGLAARDTLRLEMGYPLYGHDLNEQISPVEADLAWVVGKEHSGFIGADVILKQRESGAGQKRVGIKLTDSGVAREGAAIFVGDKEMSKLTSGGYSPSLKMSIGQAYLPAEFASEGQAVEIEVRGKRIAAVVQGVSFMPARTKQRKKAA